MSLHPARFSSRANSPRVQFSCLKKSSSIETKPYDTTANLEESKGWGRWRLGRRGNYTCVGGSGTPLKSFGYFLPDLTSRCAHLMPFQLPQTVPQPQRQREGGITVGRRGAAARGDAQSRGARKNRLAAARHRANSGQQSVASGSAPLLVRSGEIGHSTPSAGWGKGDRVSSAYLSGTRCPSPLP